MAAATATPAPGTAEEDKESSGITIEILQQHFHQPLMAVAEELGVSLTVSVGTHQRMWVNTDCAYMRNRVGTNHHVVTLRDRHERKTRDFWRAERRETKGSLCRVYMLRQQPKGSARPSHAWPGGACWPLPRAGSKRNASRRLRDVTPCLESMAKSRGLFFWRVRVCSCCYCPTKDGRT